MKIPVFLASDDYYAPFMCTTMYSVLEHTNDFVEFYVLDNKISEKSKSLTEKSLKEFKNYSVEYLDITELGIDKLPNIGHYTANTFSRYYIPMIKPNIEKMLYIDVDIIVKSDIAEFFNQDISGYAMGATSEDFYAKNKACLKEYYPEYKDESDYFNAGILVIDNQEFIKNNYAQILLDTAIKYKDYLHCPSQDVMNIVPEGKVKILNQKFDYMPDHYDFYKNFRGKEFADDLKKNAVIIHYTAGKPWHNNSCANEDFWTVVNKTKFQKDIKNMLKIYEKSKRKPLLQNIFSITNEKGKNGKKYKVVTILGVKLKFKIKEK